MDKWPGRQNGGNHSHKYRNIEKEYRKRMKRNEDSLRDLWDNIKHTNIHNTEFQKRRERKNPQKYLKR